MKVRLRLFFVTIFLGFFCNAQLIPLVRNFEPQDYQAGNQNWDITESRDGHIFVANNDGLLVYNGELWTCYKLRNNSIIRSVEAIDNRIFSGGYQNLGFWERNNLGEYIYTSFTNTKFGVDLKEDEEIWQVVQLGRTVVFQSFYNLYIYNVDDNEIRVEPLPGNIVSMFVVNNTILFSSSDKGLYQYSDRGIVAWAYSKPFESKDVVSVYANLSGFLVLTKDDGLFQVDSNTNSVDKVFSLDDTQVFSSLLVDGVLYLGTIDLGVFSYNLDTNTFEKLNKEMGLGNNTVLSIFKSVKGNLWLGLDYGISFANYASNFEFFNPSLDIGTIYSFAIKDSVYYVGTNQGLYSYDPSKPNDIELIKGSLGQVWNVSLIDDHIIIGHDKGTFVLKDSLYHVGGNTGVWNFIKIADNYILKGTYQGLSLLEMREDGFYEKGKVDGVNFSVRKMVFINQILWVDHSSKPNLLGYKINLTTLKADLVAEVPKPNFSSDSDIAYFDGDLIYYTKGRFYRLDREKDALELFDEINEIVDSVYKKSSNTLVEGSDGSLWFFDDYKIFGLSKLGFERQYELREFILPREYREQIPGFESIYMINENQFIVGSVNSFFVLKDSGNSIVVDDFSIDKIIARDETDGVNVLLPTENPPRINYDFNTIEFKFSNNNHDVLRLNQFQYRLEPLEEQWTISNGETVSYYNLKYGSYNLVYRSKDGGVLQRYSFEIDRPYYFSNIAFLFYFLSFLGLVYLVHRVHEFFYDKKRNNLILLNNRKLELQSLKSAKELAIVQNEKLKHELELKNKEVSMTTLTVSKKNQVLSQLKKEVLEMDDSKFTDHMLRLIDRNLSMNEDWELVEATVNSMDSGFLKRLKKLHPRMTPNDIKFCGYLRMNLSSKEMVPLLNISLKSIEVKRYRLRKKLDLEYGVKLTDYILSI